MAPLAAISSSSSSTSLAPANNSPGNAEAVDLDAIEQQKENIQPLASGRSAKALHTLFTSDRKALQDELAQGHERFKREIEQVEADEADDPLDVYHRYVRWTLASYPSGPSHASHLVPLLERSTRRFVHEEQYKSDVRLLKLWLLYSKYVDCPRDIFRFLEGLQVGTKLAGFYEEWALVEEQNNSLPSADAIYNLGIARRAQPLERLKKRREAFQARMLLPRLPIPSSSTESQASSSSTQRSILSSSTSGPSSAIATAPFRGTAQINNIKKGALPNNGASAFAVFKDGSGDASAAASQESWTDFGTNAVRKRENERPAVPWKGETLPMEKSESGSLPASTSGGLKFEVFRDDGADAPINLGASSNGNTLSGDGQSLSRSLRGPGEAEVLRADPFRHYKSVTLADLPDVSTIPQVGETSTASKSIKTSSTASSSRSTASKASSSTTSSSSQPASSQKRAERVASPLQDIYPDGANGPEYSFEELIAARRQLRQLRNGQPGSKAAPQFEAWQMEARVLHTAWTWDVNGQALQRDPHTGRALFQYLQKQDDEAKILQEQEVARIAEQEERERRDAKRRQQELEEAERRRIEQEKMERTRHEEEIAKREREAERARQMEEQELRNRDEALAAERLLAQREQERQDEQERIRPAELYASHRSPSPETTERFQRPPSPTINTKAALAEVNAMFGKTMRFDGDGEDDGYGNDSSATEESTSSEDGGNEAYDQDTPLVPSQAETDDTFWSMAQSQSQQPAFSQLSLPSQSQSSSAGFGSASESESGATTEDSENELGNYQPSHRGQYLEPGEHRHSTLSRSSSSSSSASSLEQVPEARSQQTAASSHKLGNFYSDVQDENEVQASARNSIRDRSAFKPSRAPLGMKPNFTIPVAKPSFGVYREPEPSEAKTVGEADNDPDSSFGEESSEPTGYAMGRRPAGNNRFASMMDVMTPITERTCEFGMPTASASVRRDIEVNAARLRTQEESEHHQEAPAPALTEHAKLHVEHIEPIGGASYSSFSADSAQLDIPTSSRKGASCDPLDASRIARILQHGQKRLETLAGFVDQRSEAANKLTSLQRTARSRRKSGNSSRVSTAGEETPWQIELHRDVFSVREKLGEGGFGAVFRVAQLLVGPEPEDDEEDSSRQTALKVESPANVWEFYILNLLHQRLPERTRLSLVRPHRLYAYQDESHLLLDYCDQGNLLDAVNHAHDAGVGPAGTVSTGLEEVLAMFFTIELTRILECLHSYRFLHGDFKIDNCLIRLEDVPGGAARNWSNAYKRDGTGGWRYKGVTVIDFGRTVDLTNFEEGQTFSTSVKTDKHDCAEVQEGRPWVYQPDYYGLACIAHVLLFGKYLEVTKATSGEQANRFMPKEPLKRYHQAKLWTRFFDLLLNPTYHAGGDPAKAITASLKESRHDMETWLEANSDRHGKSLKGLLKKLEIWALSK